MKANEKTMKPTRPAHLLKRRRWKRKDISVEGTMRIVSAIDQKWASRSTRILINDISAGGLRAQVPSVSIDDLHVIGYLSESAWVPNILDISLKLPSTPSQRIAFEGAARWYSKIGVGPDYFIGVYIEILSEKAEERLLAFLGEEGA